MASCVVRECHWFESSQHRCVFPCACKIICILQPTDSPRRVTLFFFALSSSWPLSLNPSDFFSCSCQPSKRSKVLDWSVHTDAHLVDPVILNTSSVPGDFCTRVGIPFVSYCASAASSYLMIAHTYKYHGMKDPFSLVITDLVVPHSVHLPQQQLPFSGYQNEASGRSLLPRRASTLNSKRRAKRTRATEQRKKAKTQGQARWRGGSSRRNPAPFTPSRWGPAVRVAILTSVPRRFGPSDVQPTVAKAADEEAWRTFSALMHHHETLATPMPWRSGR
ncbi:uncharacterized protein BKA78DRAFT_43352 [Phyllosticta capitalensis]|uniref:Uncharacterized protein n=1 Tax=Phyllosticta capitalensis TaxID=121624 RepID=A0ABR1YFA9_9PEZI